MNATDNPQVDGAAHTTCGACEEAGPYNDSDDGPCAMASPLNRERRVILDVFQ
jgi:hypothetical protein